MGGTKIGIGFGLWGLGLPSPDTICDYAERAEDQGIDSIWLSDHIVARNPSFDTACIMAMWAGRTKRIKMGPSVLTMPARDPVQVAKTYATLDYLSGSCNRVIMAVGLGSDPKDCQACGVPLEKRGKRMAEAVEVMRKLWAGPNVTHQGEFYQFEDVTIEPRPAKGALDVWIGGGSDLAIKRTARYGDGWFPSLVTPQEYAVGLEKLISYGKQYDREVDPDETGVLIFTHINENQKRPTRSPARFCLIFPPCQPNRSSPARRSGRQRCVWRKSRHILMRAAPSSCSGPSPHRTSWWGRSRPLDKKLFPTSSRNGSGESVMHQITARLPDTLVEALDTAAKELNRSRADIVRQAVERYLEDFDDLTVALKRLRDPADPILDWAQVRHELLGRIKRSAAKELARIPHRDRRRIVNAIDRLGE